VNGNTIHEQAELLVDRLLQEAPRDIQAVDFGMDDPAREARFVSKLKRDKRAKVIDQFGGLDLVKAGRTIFAEDELGLAYFVKWEDCKYLVLPNRHCIQIAVWTRFGAPGGIARYVFWTHLFPIHGAMMTDIKQSTDGKRFWAGRVLEALRRGLFVYRVNLVQKKHNRVLSMDQYEDWRKTVYGTEPKHEQERLVILDKPL
jgi:hypothetical protein